MGCLLDSDNAGEILSDIIGTEEVHNSSHKIVHLRGSGMFLGHF
jgi:uncharacterized protein with ATP-grasp and redox domains